MNAMVVTAAPRDIVPSVLHLVRFDLRRFRWLALMVVALEITRAAFVEWAMHAISPVIGAQFGGTFGRQEVGFVDTVLWLSTLLVVAVLVQADLPADDRAFWRTRPISPLGLALAKLTTLVLLLIAVPAAINAARLLAYGAPLQSVGAATLQLAVGIGYLVVPAWILAVVTRTLPRFAVAAVVLAIGSFLAFGAALYWTEVWSGRRSEMVVIAGRGFIADWQRLVTHGWWFAAGLTVVATSLVCAHYTHRRVGWSAAAVATMLVVSWLLPARIGAMATPAFARFGATLGVERIELPSASRIESRPKTPFSVNVGVALTAPGLPRGVSANVRLKRPTLGGTRAVDAGSGTFCCLGMGPGAVLEPAFSVETGQRLRANLGVAASDLDALRQPSVSIDTDVELRFVEHRWIGSLPLRPGAAFRSGRQVIEILAYEPERRTVLVRYTRFPSLDPRSPDWSLFAGPTTIARSSPTLPGWNLGGPARALINEADWAHVRSWVGRFDVVVGDLDALAADPRLFVVESRPQGIARTRLEKTGVAVVDSGHAPAR